LSSPDDELDAELRRLFGDERLGLQPRAGAPEAIVAGARRIRRRRTVLTSAGGVTMTVLVVAGVMTASGLHPHAKTVVAGADVTPAATDLAGPTFTLVPPPDTSSTTAGASRAPGVTLVPPTVESQARTLPPPPSAKAPQTSSDGVSTDVPPPFSTMEGPQLDSDGYGNLKLGMTEAEAESQGVVLTRTGGTEACSSYDVSGSGVPSPGAIAISINKGLVVIAPSAPVHTPEGIGPGASKSDVYATYVDATENQTTGLSASASPVSTYRFSLDDSETVENVNLNSSDQDCAG
jgi:hypothetical protein